MQHLSVWGTQLTLTAIGPESLETNLLPFLHRFQFHNSLADSRLWIMPSNTNWNDSEHRIKAQLAALSEIWADSSQINQRDTPAHSWKRVLQEHEQTVAADEAIKWLHSENRVRVWTGKAESPELRGGAKSLLVWIRSEVKHPELQLKPQSGLKIYRYSLISV